MSALLADVEIQKSVVGSKSLSGSVSLNLQVSKSYVSVQAIPVSPL